MFHFKILSSTGLSKPPLSRSSLAEPLVLRYVWCASLVINKWRRSRSIAVLDIPDGSGLGSRLVSTNRADAWGFCFDLFMQLLVVQWSTIVMFTNYSTKSRFRSFSAMHTTALWCPLYWRTVSEVSKSHSRATWSDEAENQRVSVHNH